MPEMIVALLMLVNGEIKEARIQPSFGKCMEMPRRACCRSCCSKGKVL